MRPAIRLAAGELWVLHRGRVLVQAPVWLVLVAIVALIGAGFACGRILARARTSPVSTVDKTHYAALLSRPAGGCTLTPCWGPVVWRIPHFRRQASPHFRPTRRSRTETQMDRTDDFYRDVNKIERLTDRTGGYQVALSCGHEFWTCIPPRIERREPCGQCVEDALKLTPKERDELHSTGRLVKSFPMGLTARSVHGVVESIDSLDPAPAPTISQLDPGPLE